MDRKVCCHVFHCLGSLSGFTSSRPPLFFVKRSTWLGGGFASIAADTALVIVVTSIAVVGTVIVCRDALGLESVTKYSSKSSKLRTVQSLVELSPQFCQDPLVDRILLLKALGRVNVSVLLLLVRVIALKSILVMLMKSWTLSVGYRSATHHAA